MTWRGWGFRFCRHISGKHQNGLYKTKNIAFEQEIFWPTKSSNTQPHFCWDLGQPELLQNPNHGNPPAIDRDKKLGSNTPSKVIPETNGISREKPSLVSENHQNSQLDFVGSSFHFWYFVDVFWMCFWISFGWSFECILNVFWISFGFLLTVFLDIFRMSFGCLLNVFWMSIECCLNIFWVLFECLLDVLWMFLGYLLDIS